MTHKEQIELIELLIDKIEHILTIVPDNHPLETSLKSHLSSLYYCAPEAVVSRAILIAECLWHFIDGPGKDESKDWGEEVYKIWSKLPVLLTGKVEDPTNNETSDSNDI